MCSCSGFGFGYWWIFPILMIGMMALCFFLMRGHMGSMMCGPGERKKESPVETEASATDTLNKRHAQGEIDKQE